MALAIEASAGDLLRGGLDHDSLGDEAFPLAPVALVEGRLYDVVSGDRGRAIVGREGLEALAPKGARLCFAKGERFADGMIEVSESAVNFEKMARKKRSWRAGLLKGESGRSTAVSLRFRATRDYEDVTLCLLLFNDLGERAIEVQGIGDLMGEVESEESFEIPVAYDSERGAISYYFLFFTAEGEIVTNGREAMTPFLNRLFRDFYMEVVVGYMQAEGTSDAPVKLAHRYPVFVDPKWVAQDAPDFYYFTLEVDEQGFVSDIVPEAPVDEALLLACRRSLQEWLFLPKLRSGLPVKSRVRVPILLR